MVICLVHFHHWNTSKDLKELYLFRLSIMIKHISLFPPYQKWSTRKINVFSVKKKTTNNDIYVTALILCVRVCVYYPQL